MLNYIDDLKISSLPAKFLHALFYNLKALRLNEKTDLDQFLVTI